MAREEGDEREGGRKEKWKELGQRRWMLPFAVGERGGGEKGGGGEEGGRVSGWERREGGREGKWVGEEGGREGGRV